MITKKCCYCREMGILEVSICFLWNGEKKVKSLIFLSQANSRSCVALAVSFMMGNSKPTSMVNGMPPCSLTSVSVLM